MTQLDSGDIQVRAYYRFEGGWWKHTNHARNYLSPGDVYLKGKWPARSEGFVSPEMAARNGGSGVFYMLWPVPAPTDPGAVSAPKKENT